MKISELIENLEPDLFPGVKEILLALAGDKDVPSGVTEPDS